MQGVVHALFWIVALCIEGAVVVVFDRLLRRP